MDEIKLYTPVMRYGPVSMMGSAWEFGYYLGNGCVGIPGHEDGTYSPYCKKELNKKIVTLEEFVTQFKNSKPTEAQIDTWNKLANSTEELVIINEHFKILS